MRKREEHPSYGKIVLTKPTRGGNGQTLFGSKVSHSNFIHMTISEAAVEEDGFSEFVFEGKKIVDLFMSEAQWAHMVSSFGSGTGTPVTIRWRADKGNIEEPPVPDQVIDIAKRTANDTKNEMIARLKAIQDKSLELVDKGFGKKDLRQLAHDIGVLASHISSNLDFLESQVKDRMEKEVAKANIEIEAVISNAVQRLGERALGKQLSAPSTDSIKSILPGE